MIARSPALLIALLLCPVLPSAGCYGDPESFAKSGSKAACKRIRECDQSRFEDEYGGDLGRCKDELYTDYLDYNDNLEALDCEYDPDDGKRCVQTVKDHKNDCTDEADQAIVDACGLVLEEIYDCPGLLEPGAPGPLGQLAAPELVSWPDDDPPR